MGRARALVKDYNFRYKKGRRKAECCVLGTVYFVLPEDTDSIISFKDEPVLKMGSELSIVSHHGCALCLLTVLSVM